VTVAVGGTGAGPPVRQRTGHRDQLGLDQRLVERLGRLPDPVIYLGGPKPRSTA